ncbi:hypothetical protein FRB93_007820 [Tulasnella sp. JGI-2019a]|nr:hypothetical protein FRB93_007820 [Tulasnella sp. JGI-2019a]
MNHVDSTNLSSLRPRLGFSDFLGYGLNLTNLRSIDLNIVADAVRRASRTITLDPKTTTTEVNGTKVEVPNNVAISPAITGSCTAFATYNDGDTASKALQGGRITTEMLSPLSGVPLWFKHRFYPDRQYALFGFVDTQYQARLRDWSWSDRIDRSSLKARIANLPNFNPNDQVAIDSYLALFDTIGDHIITSVWCGARFQLDVSAPNSNQPFTNDLKADVTAAFGGIPDGGKFEEEITSTSQYKAFLERFHYTSQCAGGDPTLSVQLERTLRDPTAFETYTQWAASTKHNDAEVVSFGLIALSKVMEITGDDEIGKKAPQVQKAYEWLMENQLGRIVKDQDEGHAALDSHLAMLGLLVDRVVQKIPRIRMPEVGTGSSLLYPWIPSDSITWYPKTFPKAFDSIQWRLSAPDPTRWRLIAPDSTRWHPTTSDKYW